MLVDNLISDFKEIMDKYPKAMNESQKGHPLANKMRNDFKNDLKLLVNSITNSSYNFRVSPGFMGNWANPPWAGLKSSTLSNKFTEGLYVIYHFYPEKNVIDFSINQGLTNIKRKEVISRAEKLRKQVHLIDGFSLEDFPDFEYSETAILYKQYNIDDINLDEFKDDLVNLLEVYESLIPVYEKICNCDDKQGIKNFEVLNMDERKVWRVSPGGYDISEKMSNYFIEKGYVAISFNSIVPVDDLRIFNSKVDIDEYITNHYGESEVKQNSNQIWMFFNQINIGDIILMNHGRSAVYAIGIVKSNYVPASELEFECINGYNHCRRVEWIVSKEFKLEKNTLARHTITEIKSDLWNEILLKYLSLYPEIKDKLLNDIYMDYYDNFRNTVEGINHNSRYLEESNIFKDTLKHVNNDYEQGIDITDDVLRDLISPEGYLFEFYKNLKHFLIRKYNRTDEELKKLSLEILNILNIFNRESNEKILKNILKEFDSNDLSKGIKAGLLSTSFYLLNNKYYAINNKTVKSIQLLSCFINDKIVIENTLLEYIENNKFYHDFLNELSTLEKNLATFEEFDMFSHWLTTSKLGNYANGRNLPFYYSLNQNVIDNPSESVFDIEKIIQKKGNFFDYLSDNNLIFNYKLVENYLLSLKVKPFVILTGNSGTGKTRISKEFVDYLDCNLSIVPVGSNWTDNHNIIGYYNPFTKDYFKPESYKIIESAENSDKPSFLVLDEMNLSHVEHYFSDMLSAIESNVSIPLNVNREDVEMKDFLELTDKLFIVGTVNIDETTYMFSPKVLDRANTIEFKTTKPNEYLENNDFLEVSEECDIEFLTNPFDGIEVRNMSFEDIKNKFNDVSITIHDAQRPLWDVLVELLDKFYETLEKSQFDFGFRVVNEILRFMYVAWIYEGKPSEFHNWDRYFDAQVKQKLLPKIHGSEYVIKDTLNGLKTLCEQYKLKTSNRKIDEMNKVLKEQKFVSFIN